ncbi:hypothetical protein PTW37_10270 [Arthrobacter agilis]|uniref:hypothetical protein n=1 Tax=Arthrobacter agilis TaxID=37921 RepID=UPI002365F990|nr:hypothetical protein [Arthrobacter agilis]WDF32259.1 hypothetical protein PTW37_10270 [Arthrobacter agilis]
MSDLVAIIVAILGLIGSVVGALLVVRRGRNSDRETNALTEKRDSIAERDSTIDDLREDLRLARERIDLVDAHAENRIRDVVAAADARIEKVEREQERSKRREHIRDDYINELRNHIETGLGPPAPPWPKSLYEF